MKETPGFRMSSREERRETNKDNETGKNKNVKNGTQVSR